MAKLASTTIIRALLGRCEAFEQTRTHVGTNQNILAYYGLRKALEALEELERAFGSRGTVELNHMEPTIDDSPKRSRRVSRKRGA